MNQKSLCMCISRIPLFSLGSLAPELLKEREEEVELCREREITYFVVPIDIFGNKGTVPKIEICSQIPVGLGFLPRPVESLAGYDILSRGYFSTREGTLDLIPKIGGVNVIGREDMILTENWPNVVLPQFTRRKVGIVKVSDLATSVQDYSLDGKVFVKEKVKGQLGHGGVIDMKQALQIPQTGVPYMGGFFASEGETEYARADSDNEVILSEPVNFKADEKKNLEYRCWIANNQFVAASRYGYPKDQNIPNEISDIAHDFVKAHRGRLPPYYVADFGITADRGVVLVELNDFMCAGNSSREIFGKILDAYLAA
jgi:hypothetical protein